MYKLLPAQDKRPLFSRLDGEAAIRCGAVGYLRADFGKNGCEFRTTWFDSQPHLKTPAFKKEFDSVINSLRDDGPEQPLKNRVNLEAFRAITPGKEITTQNSSYMVRTQEYSYYFRCSPDPSDYDIYCYAYDNRWLLPELEGKHELPKDCYSVLPSNGELIFIVIGKCGYYPSPNSTIFPDINRNIADEFNTYFGVTRAQEEAMLAGSLFGWNSPAAKPWIYDQSGKPWPQPPKRDAPER